MLDKIIDTTNFKPRSVLLRDTLSKIIDSEEKLKRVGEERIKELFDWFNKTGYIYRGGDSKTKQMFREIVGKVYGDHAYKILVQRPGLHFENIKDYRVFEKSIYDTMGENFVHQLINFDYSKVCKYNYNKIIDSILSSEIKMQSFKFCYDFVKKPEAEVYDYTKLFYTYSRFTKLFDDCYLHKDELTKEDLLTLKDVILVKDNFYHIVSKRELPIYQDMVKDYYDEFFEKECSIESIIEATFERFFGMNNPFANVSENDFSKDDIVFNMYTRDNVTMKILRDVYNIDRLIMLEENAKEFARTPVLKPEELCLLKIISALDKIYQYSYVLSEEQEMIVAKLYKTFEQNQDKIIRPSDVRSLFEKIPTLYAEDIKQSLTTIDNFETAIANNIPGIRKEYITRTTSFGTEIKVPVYHLEGFEYKTIVTSIQENLSGLANDYIGEVPKWYYTRNLDDLLGGLVEAEKHRKEYRVSQARKMVKLWFEKEAKTNSCVACSYDTFKSPGSMEITGANVGKNEELDPEDRVVYMMPKNTKIIAMGPTDTFSSSISKNPNVSTMVKYTKFFTAQELEHESFESSYNEVDIERYSTTTNLRASRIIPEALYKKGKEPTDMIIEHAVVMTEYLTKHGLRGKDYVFPIVMVDRSKYISPEKIEDTMTEIKNYLVRINELSKGSYDIEKNTDMLNMFICSVSNETLENNLSEVLNTGENTDISIVE